jgi:hypothetical protein
VDSDEWTSQEVPMKFILMAFLLGSLTSCSQKPERVAFLSGKGGSMNSLPDTDVDDPKNKQAALEPRNCEALDVGCLALKYPEGSSCDVSFTQEQDGLRVLTNDEIKNSISAAFGFDASKELNELPRRDQGTKFENATARAPVGQNLIDNWTDISFTVARSLIDNPMAFGRLVSCSSLTKECSDSLVNKLGPLLWRSPVQPTDLDTYYKLFSTSKSDFKESALRSIAGMLMDPRFLYRIGEKGEGSVSAFELATRMAFFIWRSAPDEALLAKAANGSLLNSEVRAAEVERLLASPRAEEAFRAFMKEWLALGNIDNLQIMGETIDPVGKRNDVLDKLSTLVFNSSQDVRLAFGKEDENVLTMPGVLGSLNVSAQTSPVKRGLYFSSRILCRKVPPPPGNAGAFKAETLSLDATPRERLKIHESNASCALCHATVDPIGLGLETFDALGRSRTQYETKVAIDPTGSMKLDGKTFAFQDAATLMKGLGSSEDLPACMTVTLSEYALGVGPEAPNSCEISAIHREFQKSGYQWKALVRAIVESPSFNRKAAQ